MLHDLIDNTGTDTGTSHKQSHKHCKMAEPTNRAHMLSQQKKKKKAAENYSMFKT